MDWLLGRYAGVAVDSMDGSRLDAFERLIARPDPEIELAIKDGGSLGGTGLDALIAELRQFHGLKPGRA